MLAHLGAARAHALAGDSKKSLDAYRRLFDLWHGADPDLPLLVQARAEYARLRDAAS